MLAPTGNDVTDGFDQRTGRPFDAEQRVDDLPSGWWAVDCIEVDVPGGDTHRLFDSVGPMSGMGEALAVWRNGGGSVGSLLVRLENGSVVEMAKIA